MSATKQGGDEKTVLIVAPHFPPAMVAGVHRARHLAKWLPSHGWKPIIIRVDERHYTQKLDPRLAELVPHSVIQERVGALSTRWMGLLGISDLGLRSFLSIRQRLAKAVDRYNPSAVIITGSPFYPMLLSGWIKRRFGLAVVLDFQDPWVSAWGASLPKWSKGGIAHRLAVALEPRALRHASFVTSVSDRQNAEMSARYPWLDASRMAGVPIGGDPADYDGIDQHDPIDRGACSNEIVYVGSMWPKAEPVVDRLIAAIAAFERQSANRVPVKFRFVGTDSRLSYTPEPQLRQLFEKHRLGSIAIEEPERLPFVQALSTMKKAKALIVFGSDETHYSASKIYPVLMSGRPFLSLFHSNSSAHATLSGTGGGIAIGFRSLAELDNRIPEITRALTRLAADAPNFQKVHPASYREFTADAIARRYAQLLEEITP